MALKKKEMNKNKKIRIFKYVLLFLFYIFSIICVITNFRWRGNPPLKWEEIPNILPIILPLWDFAGKYQTATGNIKERYQSFDLEYKGEENNDYVNGQGLCCTDNPLGRDGARTVSDTKDSETPEKLIYFYHSDHLGSSSLITNLDGEVTQHIEYIPYGEVFIEERNNVWNTPYLFNAKELDEETGLYYYGARYLNPMDAMWLSVDPLFEKYVGMSPYNYCAGNPVNFIDPDGMDYYSSTDENGNEVIQWQDSEKAFYIDEDGNSWEYYSAGQKEEVVITPTQEQKQDIKEKRAEEQDRNIKKYWSERAKNADSWEAKFGYWLKSKGGYDVDEKFSEAARPIAQGAVLFNPIISLTNSGKTLITGSDIYGNEADGNAPQNLDKNKGGGKGLSL
jgi:RHS repeat-associated protein